MHSSKRLIVWLLLAIGLTYFFTMVLFPSLANAAYIKGASFSVDLIYPKQQSDHSGAGFNVLLSPGESATFGFELHNVSKKQQTVMIRPTNANTTGSGSIDYQDWKKKPDSSMVHPFTELGAKVQAVKLPPGGSARVVQTTKMSSAPFDGVILGGYQLASKDDVLEAAKQSGKLPKKTGFVNNYAYAISVLIVAGRSENVQPDFKLQRVEPRVVNAEAALVYQLQNFKPMYLQNHGLQVTGTMTPAGSNRVVNSNGLSMSFAPNSTADIAMRFGTKEVPSGKFTLHVIAKSADRTWRFKRNFTISNAEANRLNKNNASVKQSFLWLWILIGLFVLLVVVILVVWLYRRALRRGRLEAQNGSIKNRR